MLFPEDPRLSLRHREVPESTEFNSSSRLFVSTKAKKRSLPNLHSSNPKPCTASPFPPNAGGQQAGKGGGLPLAGGPAVEEWGLRASVRL